MAKRIVPDHTVTGLLFSDALLAFKAQAIVTSDAAIDMVVHGATCLFVGVHLAPEGQGDTVANVLKTLKGQVSDARKVKGKAVTDQMLAIYVRCAHDLFSMTVGPRRDNFGGIVETIATAGTVDLANASLKAHLVAEIGATAKGISLNALRRYLGHGTGSAKAQTPEARLKAAMVTAAKAVTAGKLKPEAIITAIKSLGNPVAIIRAEMGMLKGAKDHKSLTALAGEFETAALDVATAPKAEVKDPVAPGAGEGAPAH